MNSLVDGVRGQLALYCVKRAAAHSGRIAKTRGNKTLKRDVKATIGWLKAAMLFMDETCQQYICNTFAEEVKKYQ